MAGLYFINCFYPEMWNVVCKKAKTPIEVFNSKKLFYNRILLSDSPLKPFNIRKSLKVFSGVQNVSNFRPTISKYIYDKYAPENANILDPCIGYGGRIMGAFCSDKVNSYTGTDPCVITVENNLKLIKQLKKVDIDENSNSLLPKINDTSFKLLNVPFEEYKTNSSFDLVFTSPPYFNIEKYSNESTQSWIRYKTLDKWLDCFLTPLIQTSYKYLKPNGYFIINIAGDSLIKPFLNISKKYFKLVETKQMRLSKMIGTKKHSDKKFKLEPIFIMKKQNI